MAERSTAEGDGGPGKRADTLLHVATQIRSFTLDRAWNDLSDDEYFWAPVPDAWGVRRRSECRTRDPFGAGDWVVDFDIDLSLAGAPMTTIGWLFWHIGSMPGRLTEIDFLGGRHEMASGWTSPYLTHHPVFASAADAVETMRGGWTALLEVLERTGDEALEVQVPRYTYAPAPPRDGVLALGPPGPTHRADFFVASTLNEVSHHATQICTLRDLYAAAGPAG
jgi:hypothetical protein